MEKLFYQYNPWWEGGPVLENDIIDRPALTTRLKKQSASKQIVFLTGLRRVGKTTLLKLLIHDFITRVKINPKYLFYISLDDYQLGKKSLLEITDEYRKLHKIRFHEKIVLFFDEITSQKDFELQLKNLHDSQNVKIYASSSSASVLRSKKSYLTGRHHLVEVLPLDFDEYLMFKEITIGKADTHLLESYFSDYLQTGGIPEYVLLGEMDYLKELVDDIIYKDIAAFHNIKSIQPLKDFFLLLMERSGKIMSLNKAARILNIAPDTAKRYLEFFEAAYLVYPLPRCGKTNERLLAPKKIYAADLGIRTLFTGFRDKGSLFENYIYLKIKHHHPCYLYQEGMEIDFFLPDKTLIEVKYGRDMEKKQESLFKKTKAKKKILITSLADIKKIDFLQ